MNTKCYLWELALLTALLSSFCCSSVLENGMRRVLIGKIRDVQYSSLLYREDILEMEKKPSEWCYTRVQPKPTTVPDFY